MRAIPFQPDHLTMIDLRDDNVVIGLLGKSHFNDIIKYSQAGPAYSLVGDGGAVLACAGLCPPWPGMAMAWAITSKALGDPRTAYAFTVACQIGLETLMDNMGLLRVTADVPEHSTVARAWLRRRMGFVDEGSMRAFGPMGITCHRYARIL